MNTFVVKVVSMVLVILIILLVGSMDFGLTTETFVDKPVLPSDPKPDLPPLDPKPVLPPLDPKPDLPPLDPKPVLPPSNTTPVPADPINTPKRPKWFNPSGPPEGKPWYNKPVLTK
jgi:hypothetical protein